MTRHFPALTLLLVAFSLCGCSAIPRPSFTRLDQERATPAGYDDIRQWADAPARDLAKSFVPGRTRAAGRIDVLAISSGGSGGAFAAGLLKGWTRSGRRPTFSVVTGVSTGALIAPFAFLGPAYDRHLEALYRSGTAQSLQRLQDPVSILTGNGLLNPGPLRDLIAAYMDCDLIDLIAAEHAKGRRLFVITTNLDAQRPVVWDIGKIAASRRPDSLELVRSILLASASVPAFYPPVMINAEAGRTPLSEMHVDGAATMQFFLPPEALALAKPSARPQDVHLWVVVNNTLPPEFDVTERGTIPIAYRSFATLMKSHARENATAVYEAARRLNYDFNLAFIDQQVDFRADRPFDRTYMETIFEIGERQTMSGSAWRKNIDAIRLSRRAETVATANAERNGAK
jgi:hypothetical protein